MPTNIKTVSFQAPTNALDPAGVAVQQQQIERNQQLADALRSMSLEDTQAPAGSRISWTQGLARMVEAVAANHANRQNMATEYALGTQATNADRALSNLPPLPDTVNPYSTDETGRHGLKRVGDFFRGGPPVDPRAIGQAQAARIQAALGHPDQSGSATSSPPVSPGPVGSIPTDSNGIPAGAIKPTDQVSNVPPSIPNSDPAPLPGSDPSGMADIGALTRALAAQQSGSPAKASPQDYAAALRDGSGSAPQPASPQAAAMGAALQGKPMPGADVQPTALPPSSASQQDDPHLAAASPNGINAALAPQPTPAAGASSGGASAVPMDPNLPGVTAQEGYRMRLTQPQSYAAAVTAWHTPTDFQKGLLGQGMTPGTKPFQDAMDAYNQKQSAIEMRPGGTAMIGNRFITSPQLAPGQLPDRDAQGNVVGSHMVPGFTAGVEAQNAAEARGKASTDFVQTWDPTAGVYRSVPKNTALANGGFIAEPGPGQKQGATTGADLSQKAYDADAQAGQSIPNAQQTINSLRDLAKTTLTGPGAGFTAEMKGGANYLAQSAGIHAPFDVYDVSKLQEIGKLAEGLAQQTASMMGGASGATDAKLASAIRSLPNEEKTPEAMKDITDMLAGRIAAAKAYTVASAANQTRGVSANQFKASWLSNYDPRIFEWMDQGTVAQHMQALKKAAPAEYRSLASKSQALADMGAFGQ